MLLQIKRTARCLQIVLVFVLGTLAVNVQATSDICAAAQSARARNSPAAPNLEAQCRAQTPVSSLGRRRGDAPAPGGMPPSICDQAASARDRNSPAADNLVQQCLDMGGRVPDRILTGNNAPVDWNFQEMQEQGSAMTEANPRAVVLRGQLQKMELQQGFDVGVFVTGDNTAWGPGKQKILDSLPSPLHKEGFKVAASLIMDQNRHADRALIGAGIAENDPTVGRLRANNPDPRFQLGFDIATAIFGSPALGAQGNTAVGTGSLGIRDGLSAPAKAGFNASMQFHLSRLARR